MNTPKNRVFIAIIVLVLMVMACVGGGGGGLSGSQTSSSTILGAPDATATYGAQQLKIQLTAVAKPAQP